MKAQNVTLERHVNIINDSNSCIRNKRFTITGMAVYAVTSLTINVTIFLIILMCSLQLFQEWP